METYWLLEVTHNYTYNWLEQIQLLSMRYNKIVDVRAGSEVISNANIVIM